MTGDYTVDEYGFDPEVTERFFMAALRPIAQQWFRIEVRGIENIPAEGGALVVSNHSGTIPVDGLMTMVSIHDHAGRYLRPLGADLVFRLPFVGALARKGGATLACNEDAERMLRGGEPGRGVARGLQGHRQAVLRPLQGCSASAAAASCRPHCAPACRSSRSRSSARRRSTRWSATSRRWPACSASRTSRSRRSSRSSGRSAWSRCRRSGCWSSASRSAPTSTTRAPPRTRCWSST
ncbi:1-acyl-sn-glycerol-3-phosphate acyltransferase [Nocardioides convexus]|uniref:1-acyl-sn-glycerol-3-phosphate acyltransferase n=1 Tax=Nocardioides convexus TaxID=2712224 RepID=UPI0024188306|nr:1-acyl-sn-glycerol-3-phosphate acyltransferase [Nocardioides convexus]